MQQVVPNKTNDNTHQPTISSDQLMSSLSALPSTLYNPSENLHDPRLSKPATADVQVTQPIA